MLLMSAISVLAISGALPVDAAKTTKTKSVAASKTPVASVDTFPRCENLNNYFTARLQALNVRLAQNPLAQFEVGAPGQPVVALAMLDLRVALAANSLAKLYARALYILELEAHPIITGEAHPSAERFAIGDENVRIVMANAPLGIEVPLADTCLRVSGLSSPVIGGTKISWAVDVGKHLISTVLDTSEPGSPMTINTGRESVEDAATGVRFIEPATLEGTYDMTLIRPQLASSLGTFYGEVLTIATVGAGNGPVVGAEWFLELEPEANRLRVTAQEAAARLQLLVRTGLQVEHHLPRTETTKPKRPPKPRKGPEVANGDPHFLSIDGGHLAYQGAGEYDLIASKSRDLRVQARLEPMSTTSDASVITALAMRVDGHRIAISLRPRLRLTLDGSEVSTTSGLITRTDDLIVITLKDQSRFEVKTGPSEFLDMIFRPSDARFGTLSGLGGDWDGKAGNDFRTRKGRIVDPNDAGAVYDDLGPSWRIAAADSLFAYEAGQSTATFTLPKFPGDREPSKVAAAAQAQARATCTAAGVPERLLNGCIYDVSITGDASFAQRSVALGAEISALERGTNARPVVRTDTAVGTPVDLVVDGSAWRITVVSPLTDITEAPASGQISSQPPDYRQFAVLVEYVNRGAKALPLPIKPLDTPMFQVGPAQFVDPNESGQPPPGVDDCFRTPRPPSAPGATVRCNLTVWTSVANLPTLGLSVVGDDRRAIRMALR